MNDSNDPQRRLLDLLAGWTQFVARCCESEEPHPGVTREQYEREREEIGALYQKAGSELMTPSDVVAFVRGEVLSMLMHGYPLPLPPSMPGKLPEDK